MSRHHRRIASLPFLGAVSALSGRAGDAGLMWVVYDAEALRADPGSMAVLARFVLTEAGGGRVPG